MQRHQKPWASSMCSTMSPHRAPYDWWRMRNCCHYIWGLKSQCWPFTRKLQMLFNDLIWNKIAQIAIHCFVLSFLILQLCRHPLLTKKIQRLCACCSAAHLITSAGAALDESFPFKPHMRWKFRYCPDRMLSVLVFQTDSAHLIFSDPHSCYLHHNIHVKPIMWSSTLDKLVGYLCCQSLVFHAGALWRE